MLGKKRKGGLGAGVRSDEKGLACIFVLNVLLLLSVGEDILSVLVITPCFK